MSDFLRSNKITGIYWLKHPIEELKIRIKLKIQDNILNLPKFEDYTNEMNSLNLNLEAQIEEYEFKWQEKIFSKWEFKHYGNVQNCVTDLDLSYNNAIKNLENGQKIFTYIHEDFYLSLPFIDQEKNVPNSNSWFSKISEKMQMACHDDSISVRHLFKSEENIQTENDQWTSMHIIFDNSTYNEDSDLLIKEEIILLSVYHNKSKHYIVMSPDTNDLEMNPYAIDRNTGEVLDYQYSIETITDAVDDDEVSELDVLLQKLYEKWTRKQKQLINFVMPSCGKTIFYITLQVLSASKFEMDNMYIQYNIRIPDGVKSSDVLCGRTHVSEPRVEEEDVICHFGHNIDLNLEIDSDFDPQPLKLFFEVISTDWWGRHRTEGYSHLSLPLIPGEYERDMTCICPEEADSFSAGSRRYLLGGCHLLNDLDDLIKPERDPSVLFQSTGEISLRWSTIRQSSTSSSVPLPTPGTSASSDVLLGAEAAISRYRKARAKLKAVTKDLEAGDG